LGGQVIIGGCVSRTVTVKVQIEVLPAASVAVTVTVVVPEKAVPDGGLATTCTPGQLSVAEKLNVTTAEHIPGAAGTVMLAGHITAGGCVSFTVTVKEQFAVLPAASITLQLTFVAPSGNTEPDTGLHIGALTPGQLSAAFTL
jgi:hypothetical protein